MPCLQATAWKRAISLSTWKIFKLAVHTHSEFRKVACATALGCRYVGEVVRMSAQFIIPDPEAASEATDAVPKAASRKAAVDAGSVLLLDDSDSDTQSDDDGLRTLR